MMNEPDIPGPDRAVLPASRRLPAGSCDSHAHVFGSATQYPFDFQRQYTPPVASRDDYLHLLRTLGFERAVLVQPSVYGTDNRCLVDVLRESARAPAGIQWRAVAVLDANVEDDALSLLHDLGVRGVRINRVFGGGTDMRSVRRLAARIAPFGWHLQFLVDISRHKGFSLALSELPVDSVIDHFGHMPARLGAGHPAFVDLLALMQEKRTWVKLSGPSRITSAKQIPYNDVDPLARALIEAAPEQLLFGTDWPHVKLPTEMPNDGQLLDEFRRWTDNDPTVERHLLVNNPGRLYGF
ncbi:MAG: amidohydrolase family protein [Aquisalimonadaceae bacterium]